MYELSSSIYTVTPLTYAKAIKMPKGQATVSWTESNKALALGAILTLENVSCSKETAAKVAQLIGTFFYPMPIYTTDLLSVLGGECQPSAVQTFVAVLKQKFRKNNGEGSLATPNTGSNRVVKTTLKNKAATKEKAAPAKVATTKKAPAKSTSTKSRSRSEDEMDGGPTDAPITPPKTPAKSHAKRETTTPTPVPTTTATRSSRGAPKVNYAAVNNPFSDAEEELQSDGSNGVGKGGAADKLTRGHPAQSESDDESIEDAIIKVKPLDF